MVFSNPCFFAFLAVTLGLLWLPFSLTTRKRLLTIMSALFYAAWDARYLALLAGISVVDYFCARRIARARGRGERGRGWVLASVVSNLGLLAYFKYANFFLENVAAVGGPRIVLSVLLPAGISFYTFKTMSYVIDVYRGELEAQKSWLDYAMFITFFPELIAGPIVRASVFLPQMDRDIGPRADRLTVGGSLFLVGYSKKVMADHLGTMVTPVFDRPAVFDGPSAWAALIGYTLQIHLDFSGYSDMAIGVARMIGYSLPENFRMPYLSSNLAEFWRRWHMTLSTWLRDYLYVGLGGNRRGTLITYRNLFLTMVLGGLWHGASWNFVLWGALHGAGLAAHRWLKGRAGGRPLVPAVVGAPITFLFVALCWVPFRCTTFGQTRDMLSSLVFRGGAVRWLSVDLFVIVAIVVAGHIVGTVIERETSTTTKPSVEVETSWSARLLRFFGTKAEFDPITGPYLRLSAGTGRGAYLVATWILLVLIFAETQTTPFIYFQF
ncbi:MAG: MBOAT family O-acyltransferase [Rubrivivax sp.]